MFSIESDLVLVLSFSVALFMIIATILFLLFLLICTKGRNKRLQTIRYYFCCYSRYQDVHRFSSTDVKKRLLSNSIVLQKYNTINLCDSNKRFGGIHQKIYELPKSDNNLPQICIGILSSTTTTTTTTTNTYNSIDKVKSCEILQDLNSVCNPKIISKASNAEKLLYSTWTSEQDLEMNSKEHHHSYTLLTPASPLLYSNDQSSSASECDTYATRHNNVIIGFFHRFSLLSNFGIKSYRKKLQKNCQNYSVASSPLSSTLSLLFGSGNSLSPASSHINLHTNKYFKNSLASQRRATCTILNSSSTSSSRKLSLKTQNSNCLCDAKRREAFGHNYCCLQQKPLNLLSPKQRLSPALLPHLSSTLSSTTALKFNLSKTGQRSSSNYYLPPAGLSLPSNQNQDSGGDSNGGGGEDVNTDSLFFLSPNSQNRYLTARNGVFKFNNNIAESDCNNENYDNDREIDNRSVMHYESGFYEKTFATNCFRGILTFQLRYDFIHRVLMLHVIKANHLLSPEDLPDPYIKMYCLPERRHHCKTRILKKTCNAEFNEMFSFDVPYNQLANRMLQFTVYDFDRFTRHGLIGNVIMRDLFEKSDLCNWTEYTMQIVGSQEKNDFGDLLLYLAYSLTLKKLFITISKAYNLRPMDITGASDPYVRIEQIFQRRRVKLRKTSIKRANLNPVYHECFEFDLPPEQIEETNFLVQIMDWDRIGSDDLLGCCVLGKESPTKEGRQQWDQLFEGILRPFSKFQQNKCQLNNSQKNIENYKLENVPKFIQNNNINNGNIDSTHLYNKNNHINCVNNLLEKNTNCQKLLFKNNQNGNILSNDDGEYASTVDETIVPLNKNKSISNNTTTNTNCSFSSKSKLSISMDIGRIGNGAPTFIVPGLAINCNETMNMNDSLIPQAIGTWHSILGEVPEGFRNIPKAKK